MSADPTTASAVREPQLLEQTVVLIGGSAGIRLETATTGPYYAPLAEFEFDEPPLSASLLGDQLAARREQLRTTLPIGRVVGPEDIAALAVHLMTNTAVTGATFDIDGGQQLVG
jgi:NAD(P)-dependent dehydrogenase (short-subunit alcohol dehydrogenase family)